MKKPDREFVRPDGTEVKVFGHIGGDKGHAYKVIVEKRPEWKLEGSRIFITNGLCFFRVFYRHYDVAHLFDSWTTHQGTFEQKYLDVLVRRAIRSCGIKKFGHVIKIPQKRNITKRTKDLTKEEIRNIHKYQDGDCGACSLMDICDTCGWDHLKIYKTLNRKIKI